MSRRDTILMAVLINAGLLVILFATAITTDVPITETTLAIQERSVAKTQSQVPASESSSTRDEIDGVITAFQSVERSEPVIARFDRVFPEGIAPVALEFVQPMSIQSPADGGRSVEVTVKRGDSLDKIARANGTTIAAIQDANALLTTRLQIGQLLLVPLGDAGPKKRTVGSVDAELASEKFYVIQSGDNPWAIAMKEHIPLDDLLKMNNLDEAGARRLRPGDKIRIR